MLLATNLMVEESTAWIVPFETTRQAPLAFSRSLAKARGLGFEMTEYLPKQVFGHTHITFLVGIGQAVAAGKEGVPDHGQSTGMIAQVVAQVIEGHGRAELSEQHGDHVTPWGKGPSLLIDLVFARQLTDKMGRNQLANLAQNRQIGFGLGLAWFYVSFSCSHPDWTAWTTRFPALFTHSLWDACAFL